MNEGLIEAIIAIERERGIDREILFEAIEEALKKAYRNHYSTEGNVRAEIDKETGVFNVYSVREVGPDDFEEYDPLLHIYQKDARALGHPGELGDEVETLATPKSFGRIAAQTAKQVVLQRIKDAERQILYDEFSGKLQEVVTGVVRRVENGNVFLELGRSECLLPVSEQVPGEVYTPGDRLKVYVLKVDRDARNRDTSVIVSRKNREIIKRLFELEVHEIMDGVVQIKAVSREPGVRSKVAVFSTDPQVDPVGSCVGQKGSRVERIVSELQGEKIDIIPYSTDPIEFIANSLSAAKVIMVQVNEAEKIAKVIVPDNQLSLAIGVRGINAKLAARLTGWKIDIKNQSQAQEIFEELAKQQEEEALAAQEAQDYEEQYDAEREEIPSEETSLEEQE